MLPEERRLHIVEQVRAKPLVRADELARRFGVSIETVRRDLHALQRDGLIRRVYGGATGIVPHTLEAPFDQRQGLHLEAKRSIARLAASLVEPTDAVVPGAGPPPCGWFTLRTAEFLDHARLKARQGQHLLWSKRHRHLVPTRAIHARAPWIDQVEPTGGPVTFSVAR